MSTIVSLQKELELTKAELLHANETIALLAKGEDDSVTEHVSAELLKTIDMLKSAQREIRSLKIKKGLLATEHDKLTKKYNDLYAERSKFNSECSKLRNENKQLILEASIPSSAYKELKDTKLKVLQDELDRVNAYCKTLNLERAKFQSEADILKNEKKELCDYNASFKKENKRLQNENLSLKEENDVLKSENVVLHSSNVELSVSAGLSDVVDNSGYWNDEIDEKEEMFKNLNFLVTQLRKNS